jgi:hypothetical protein
VQEDAPAQAVARAEAGGQTRPEPATEWVEAMRVLRPEDAEAEPRSVAGRSEQPAAAGLESAARRQVGHRPLSADAQAKPRPVVGHREPEDG